MEKLTIRKLEKKDAAEISKINAEGLGGTDDLSLVQEKIDKLDPARDKFLELFTLNATTFCIQKQWQTFWGFP